MLTIHVRPTRDEALQGACEMLERLRRQEAKGTAA
jgi:hypothetical protein